MVSLSTHPSFPLSFPLISLSLCCCAMCQLFNHMPLWWLPLSDSESLSSFLFKVLTAPNSCWYFTKVLCDKLAVLGDFPDFFHWRYPRQRGMNTYPLGTWGHSPKQAWESFKGLCFVLKIHGDFIFCSINIHICVTIKIIILPTGWVKWMLLEALSH